MAAPYYLRVLRQRWKIVAAAVLLGLIGGAMITAQTTPHYAASITMFVSAVDVGEDAGAAYQASLMSQQRVQSYVELIRSQPMAVQLAEDLGSDYDPERLRERIVVEPLPDSVLLRVKVTDPSPRQAERILQLLGAGFSKLVTGLESHGVPGSAPVQVTVVGRPDVSREPVSPRPLVNLLLGLMFGATAGFGAALLRDRLDNSIRGSEEAKQATGAPTLGVIRFDRASSARPLLTQLDPLAPRVEAFRSLRTNLRYLGSGRPVQTILVTSCGSGDGKSTTVCNLAISIARGGSTVAVVDADLRQPSLARYLGIEGVAGLANVLIGQVDLTDVLQPWGRDGLLVLPSGPMPPNPADLLGSLRMREVLAEIVNHADVVLLDTPPLLPVADAAVLSRACDGVLLVVRHGRTTNPELRQAVDQLGMAGSLLLGQVLSMAPEHQSREYGYGHTYGAKRTTPIRRTAIHDGANEALRS